MATDITEVIPDALTTTDNVKTMLSISGTKEDALIELLIPEVSGLIANSCQRKIFLAANAANPITEYYNGDNDPILIIKEWPIQGPILRGNALRGSNLITDLPNVNYLFPGQGVVGPGIPVNTFVLSVDSTLNEVAITNPLSQDAISTRFMFDMAVFEDAMGAWGAGQNAFAPNTQLYPGTDYGLKRDLPNGIGSDSAIAIRLNAVWPGDVYKQGDELSAWEIPGRGNIQVTYWCGYQTLPPELELAAIRTIALIRSTRLYGQIIQSQNYADKVASYAYTLAH